jgi:hypothetical protein
MDDVLHRGTNEVPATVLLLYHLLFPCHLTGKGTKIFRPDLHKKNKEGKHTRKVNIQGKHTRKVNIQGKHTREQRFSASALHKKNKEGKHTREQRFSASALHKKTRMVNIQGW